MKAKVFVSALAESDIDEIALYLFERNLEIGIKFHSEVQKQFSFLADWPEAGIRRQASDMKLKGTRSWVMRGSFVVYVIFYRSIAGGVEIVRVVHGQRDIERLIGPRF